MKTMPDLSEQKLSANLDMLRAVAVMCVFLSHFLAECRNPNFGSLGRFGVALFFVHTSFVLMGSLQRLEKTAWSDISLVLAFWIRRIFRIYPLSILCVVLMTTLRIPADPGGTYTWIGLKGLLSNLALIQNLTHSPDIQGPFWTLPLEMQMYFILPFGYFAIRGERRYRSLALWILSIVLALISPLQPWLNVLVYAPIFTSGIVAFDLKRSLGSTWKLPAWIWPIGIFAVIVLFGPHSSVVSGWNFMSAWWLSLLLGVLYANVEEGRSNWISAVFHWIAEHSYGIYLSHSVVLWIAFHRMAQFPLWARIAFLITGAIGIPALLHASIEKPLIRAGGDLARRVLRHS